MNSKSKKSTAGITLIALVITIVVLIILATISIQAVLGDNGLIKQAEKAADARGKRRGTTRGNIRPI